MDDAGNIYFLESLEGVISVYNKDGKIIRQFGKKGQGPGEFVSPVYLSLSPEKKVCVLDRPGKAIQIFDLNGKWLERRQLPSIGTMNNLKFDLEGGVYIQDMRSRLVLKDEKRIKRGVPGLSRLQRFNSRFETIMEVVTWENRFLKGAGFIGFNILLYHDIFCYDLDSSNCLYYGDSSRYEIHQMTPEGRVIKIIKKKAKRIRTTSKDLGNYLKDFPEMKDQDYEMSETKPFFFDVHILDKIGLLVGTYEDEWNGEGILFCDLFDQDGFYIAKVKAPRYYAKDQDVSSEQRNRLFKNGRCYSLIYNEKDETLELVRHSVELKWPQPKSDHLTIPGPGR